MRRLFLALGLCLLILPAFAVEPDEVLGDPALEARARAISAELRCLVCQNQSIDSSDAELAGDLRVLVRERLLKGDSDQQVREYVVARYGEFVLLKPVFALHTLILWLAAPLILLVGLCVVLMRRRTLPEGEVPSLSAEEVAALKRLEDGSQP